MPARRWIEIHLEHLLGTPGPTLAKLCRALGVREEPALHATLRHLIAHPVNALHVGTGEAQAAGRNPEIVSLLERIARLAPVAGYSVDPHTGRAAPL